MDEGFCFGVGVMWAGSRVRQGKVGQILMLPDTHTDTALTPRMCLLVPPIFYYSAVPDTWLPHFRRTLQVADTHNLIALKYAAAVVGGSALKGAANHCAFLLRIQKDWQ